MAQAVFLKLTGIDGEATDDKHNNEINVQSWSWGASQQATYQLDGGGTAGRAQVQDLTFVHNYDKASPNLMMWCCQGKKIDEAVLTQLKAAGDDKIDFLKVTLNDCVVSSVNPSGGGDNLPIETVSINFAKYKIEYTKQKEDLTGDSVLTQIFDIKLNKKT
jgi:type VI secretion system secreted protein Hcp